MLEIYCRVPCSGISNWAFMHSDIANSLVSSLVYERLTCWFYQSSFPNFPLFVILPQNSRLHFSPSPLMLTTHTHLPVTYSPRLTSLSFSLSSPFLHSSIPAAPFASFDPLSDQLRYHCFFASSSLELLLDSLAGSSMGTESTHGPPGDIADIWQE